MIYSHKGFAYNNPYILLYYIILQLYIYISICIYIYIYVYVATKKGFAPRTWGEIFAHLQVSTLGLKTG